jgi:multidrug resistance protein, MATE family
MFLGGIGLAVQTVVAQAFGGRRYRRASQAVWLALWAIGMTVPLYILTGWFGPSILAPFELDPAVQQLAAEFWFPRVAGSFFGAAAWAVLGFFNGIGQPRITLATSIIMAGSNAILNQWFIFELNWGIWGAGLATSIAQALGFLFALSMFLHAKYRHKYRPHLTWRLKLPRLRQQFALGFPMGVLYTADLGGAALFQIMQVKLAASDGAATQIAMMLTSIAYLPGVGLALAGTTLVGQSIGAGHRQWAAKLGNFVIALTAGYMGGVGLLLAAGGPWLVPWFIGAQDPHATVVIQLATQILWLAAVYQLFDGLNLASGFCLRGAGDVAIPATLTIILSWFFFVPLTHSFTFAPGQGWVDFLPQLSWGVLGGWSAFVIYLSLLGSVLFLRWRSGAWQKKCFI